MQPERVSIAGGHIEVHPSDYVTVTRQADGQIERGPARHIQANVHVYLDGEDGLFAFTLSPTSAVLLAQAVARACPDAAV